MTAEPARIHGRYHLLPFPQPFMAWFVWDEQAADMKPDGPYPVLAAAFPSKEFSWDGEAQFDRFKDANGKIMRELWTLDDPLDINHEGSMEYALDDPWFFVLWPNMAEVDGPWIKRKYIFFSEAAALKAIENRLAVAAATDPEVSA